MRSGSWLVAMMRRAGELASSRWQSRGARPDQVLAVVEREQHPPRPEGVGEGVNERAARFPDHAHGRCHPRDDKLGFP